MWQNWFCIYYSNRYWTENVNSHIEWLPHLVHSSHPDAAHITQSPTPHTSSINHRDGRLLSLRQIGNPAGRFSGTQDQYDVCKTRSTPVQKQLSQIHYHYFQLYRWNVFSRRTLKRTRDTGKWNILFVGMTPLCFRVEVTTTPKPATRWMYALSGVEVELSEVQSCSVSTMGEISTYKLHEPWTRLHSRNAL